MNALSGRNGAAETVVAQAWSGVFHEPDQLAMALRDADVEYMSMRPGDYDARFSALQIGPLSLQIARDGPHLARGAVARHRSMLLLPIGGVAQGLRVNGYRPVEHDTVVLGEHSGLNTFAPGNQDWAAITVTLDAMAVLGLDRMQLAREDFAVHRNLLALVPGLVAELAALERLAVHEPGRFAAGSVAASMMESLCARIAAGLQGDAASERPARALHRRVQLVAMAEDLAAAEIDRPIYTQDLCSALGVAPRTLHGAFNAVFGMSPHRYLRIRRLHLARNALLRRDAGPSLVKSVALEHGFWHLGRFAQEYRALFGESPSSALRTAQPVAV